MLAHNLRRARQHCVRSPTFGSGFVRCRVPRWRDSGIIDTVWSTQFSTHVSRQRETVFPLRRHWNRLTPKGRAAGARRWIETAGESETPQEREVWMESRIRACPLNDLLLLSTQAEEDDDILSSAAWSSLLSIGSSIDDHGESGFVGWPAYHSVLKAWSTSGFSESPQRAEYWILRQERYYKSIESLLEMVQTTTVKDEDSRKTQQAVLPILQAVSQRVAPNVHSYNAVLESWARARSVPPTAVVRAQRWLNKMVKSPDFTPTIESYNFFLDVCTKGCARQETVLRSNALLAENTLNEMVQQQVAPDTDSYNFVLRGWTRLRQDATIASRVMAIIRQMESHHRTHVMQAPWYDSSKSPVRPNSVTYNHAVNAWAIIADLRGRKERHVRKRKNRLQRRERTTNDEKEELREEDQQNDTVQDALDSAESIVKYVHDIHNAGGEGVAPNTVLYNTLLRAYAGVADGQDWVHAPLRAEEILRRMIDASDEEAGGMSEMAPDSRSYLHVMKAWVKTKRPNGAARVEWWIRRLSAAQGRIDAGSYEDNDGTSPVPTIEMYNLLMEAYCGLYDCKKVDEIGSNLFEREQASLRDHQLVDGKLKGKKQDVQVLLLNNDSFSVIIRSWLQHETRLANGVSDADAMDGEGCLMAFFWLEELICREEEQEELYERGEDSPLCTVSVTPDLLKSFLRTASQSRACDLLYVTSFAFERYRQSRFRFESASYVWLLQVGMRELSYSASPSSLPTMSIGKETLVKSRVRKKFLQDVYQEGYRDKTYFVQQLLQRCCDDGHLTSNMVQTIVNGPTPMVPGAALSSEELSEIVQEYFSHWPLPPSWSRNVVNSRQIPTKSDLQIKY